MNRPLKSILPLTAVVAFVCLVSTSVYSNSGPSHWVEKPGLELLVVDENSTISVENEVLTFDVSYFSGGDYKIDAGVSASYNMVNDARIDKHALMAFPLVSDYRTMENNDIQVLVDGQAIDYSIYPGSIVDDRLQRVSTEDEQLYSYKNILSGINNDFVAYDNLSRDSFGRLYTLRTDGGSGTARLLVFLDDLETSSKVISSGFNTLDYKDERPYLGSLCSKGDEFYVFVYDGGVNLNAGGYEDWEANMPQDLSIEGSSQVMTYGEFYDNIVVEDINRIEDIFGKENSPYVYQQQYNVLSERIANQLENSWVANLSSINGIYDSITYKRLFTLVYQVDFQAKEERRVDVSYHMPGSYDARNEDEVIFTLDYVLNSASYWKDFRNLTVKVKMDPDRLAMISSTMDFQEGEPGQYLAKSEDLPQEDLQLVLKADKNTKYKITTRSSEVEGSQDAHKTNVVAKNESMFFYYGLAMITGLGLVLIIAYYFLMKKR